MKLPLEIIQYIYSFYDPSPKLIIHWNVYHPYPIESSETRSSLQLYPKMNYIGMIDCPKKYHPFYVKSVTPDLYYQTYEKYRQQVDPNATFTVPYYCYCAKNEHNKENPYWLHTYDDIEKDRPQYQYIFKYSGVPISSLFVKPRLSSSEVITYFKAFKNIVDGLYKMYQEKLIFFTNSTLIYDTEKNEMRFLDGIFIPLEEYKDIYLIKRRPKYSVFWYHIIPPELLYILYYKDIINRDGKFYLYSDIDDNHIVDTVTVNSYYDKMSQFDSYASTHQKTKRYVENTIQNITYTLEEYMEFAQKINVYTLGAEFSWFFKNKNKQIWNLTKKMMEPNPMKRINVPTLWKKYHDIIKDM